MSAGFEELDVMRPRSGSGVPVPGVSLPPRPVAGLDENAFEDAVTGGEWAMAAGLLAEPAVPAAKLPPLTMDQLRLLQDGVIRACSGPAGVSAVLQAAIAAELRSRGVPVARVAPGAAFGAIEVQVEEVLHGDQGTGTGYAYKINISFTPDPTVVRAEEIAFIQTARLVGTASGSNRISDRRLKNRQTPSATNVDRRVGKKQGWYGMNDNGAGGTMLTVWQRSAPATPARMCDRASWDEPDTTWQFEAMVVCCSGADLGTVYGVVTWGFSVDGDLRLTEHGRTVTNKPSPEAIAAVARWNDQAVGSVFDRNAPGQLPLPALT